MDHGSDAGSQELNGPQHLLLRKRRDTHLKSNTRKAAESFVHVQHLLSHGVGVADQWAANVNPTTNRRSRSPMFIVNRILSLKLRDRQLSIRRHMSCKRFSLLIAL